MSTSSLRSIHVVAGVITDTRGRILLARRTGNSDLAGLWEFPGGKREPGETSEDALIRELREELGIEAEVGERLIEVPQLYPDKRLRLEVRRITRWKGSARGREGQALTWVPADKLLRYSMPPADQPVVAVLRQPDHYLVTPAPEAEESDWRRRLSSAVRNGIKRIQLRAGHAAGSGWKQLVRSVVADDSMAGVEVLLNRDVDLARELGIGVHLGSEQLSRLDARPLPQNLPVAASCHTEASLRAAQRLGCDFVVLGPLRWTASHPEIDSPLGWTGFASLRETVSLPIYAIGGLSMDDVVQAREHGAQGIAAIRGLWPD
ncbi:MAG: Nudix family hydrolase [Xanthomonadaceae bacterium]|jgi:8-oxo-dGTP diphosphatase|nr:Nudix family hydrolase [Xanthomonadaceae bacterium]